MQASGQNSDSSIEKHEAESQTNVTILLNTHQPTVMQNLESEESNK